MPILDNEAYIGALLDNVEYGTINSRESLAGFIEDFRREQEQYNRSNARPSWEGGTDERVRGLDIRQSANGKRSDVGTEEDNLLFRDSEAEPFYGTDLDAELSENGISIDNKAILKEYGLSSLTLDKRGSHIILSKIVAEKQGEGNGTRFMNDLSAWADENGYTLALTPDDSFGASSTKRLKDFYKRFGFKENKGRNADFETRESLIRRPANGIRYRLVDDQAEIDRLESEPTIKAYRAMQVINGELYPPMSAVVDGKLREPIALGQWEQSEKRPITLDMLSAVIE